MRITLTRAFVTGQCKTWKREPERFEIGVVHGMRDYGQINQSNCEYWHLASECPLNEKG